MKFLIVLALTVTYVIALPSPKITQTKSENIKQYRLTSLLRHKRQSNKSSFDFKSPGTASISHTGTILNNDNHRLDGTGYATKDFSRGNGLRPDSYGGSLDYLHKPSGSTLGVGADHVRHGGTDLRATGTWNFIHNKNTDVGLTGQYGRHFGPGGSKPDYGVFLGGQYRF